MLRKSGKFEWILEDLQKFVIPGNDADRQYAVALAQWYADRDAGRAVGPRPQPPSTTALLAILGFQRIGRWALIQGKPRVTLEAHARGLSDCVYAFVSGGNVLYLGKSTSALRARMSAYQSPGPSQTTNKKCNARIRALLETGEHVDVWAISELDVPLVHRGVKLSVAGALEEPLIEKFRPEWNTQFRLSIRTKPSPK